MIDKAIERSSNTDSIVTVPVISLHEALDALRDRGETFDHVSVDGYEDVWDTNGEWRLRLTPEITSEQIEDLRAEAKAYGDQEQVEICDRAIKGDEAALEECARVIDAAQARR